MNDNRRIITLQEFAKGRQDRRGSLADLNRLFAKRIKELEDLNSRQAAHIKSMNVVFTDIATTIGTPVPKTAAEGIEALEQMRARIIALVEMEKRQTSDLK
jgi:hypothetical protein